ncbi:MULTISPECIES: pyridoxamine 5'-phosphate oxidase [unclassified Flavobacterium]|uniref:pyridoxamine 5'-phosphate oxidase n=1 Tax=unclassified Flavobacterium TaxID=196869 RepID=UPI001F141067|nr:MULTISPECIES: pyridoxamine 5'-phosphate oxidase [unclassified Flavobacterium]UMY65381.1 pyridoxamine 5'-phosphate oxidase [Flavobacterium sp. HJ-32-4]
MKDLRDYRKSYDQFELIEDRLPSDPMPLFEAWFDEADAARAGEANAMTLSTVSQDGHPSGRIVLLKEFNPDGFVFFTNYASDKGQDIAQNPNVSLSFFWQQQERQVIIKGTAEKLPAADSEAYFASRPFGSQLGAWASRQSEAVPGRQVLEERLSQLEAEYEGKTVPRPEHWGGYLVRPVSIEFWQGRPNRLHDRIRYVRAASGWTSGRLSP